MEATVHPVNLEEIHSAFNAMRNDAIEVLSIRNDHHH